MAITDLIFRNFSGGVNLRDAASELDKTQFPQSSNVTIDERGYVQKRLGYEDRFGMQVGTGLVSNLYYWATKGIVVSQIGTQLHKDSGAAFHTFTTADRCGICEFAGNLFYTHPVDGGYVYDGTTVTAVPSAPKGNTCSAWQNRVWANDVTSLARLWKSDLLTATAWTNTNFNDLREKDSARITCITGASGIDIAGRPGLLVAKEASLYRINDPATMGYTTIDPSVGAAGALAAINAYGRTFFISAKGIYSSDGLSPCVEESKLIVPLFNKNIINLSQPDLFAAGRHQDRIWFSIPAVGQTMNTIAIEYHPGEAWMVLHTNAASSYATIGESITDLVFGSPSVAGRIYNHNKGGTDAGVAITSQFQTRWQEPNNGRKARLRNVRFTGRGSFNADIFMDYQDGASRAAYPVVINPGGGIWDDPSSQWDNPLTLWGPLYFQSSEPFYSVGVCRAVSVNITETGSSTIQGRSIAGVPLETGGWTLSNINFLVFELGMF